MPDELLDLVDSDDRVIGRKCRSEVYALGLTNFRVVNAFLINNNGRLWIPRRHPHKRLFPRCLDASMGGHVSSGESYEEAFRREMYEELRMDVSQMKVDFLGALNPIRDGTSAFMQVYALQFNDVPDYNRADFVEYFWLTPRELLDRLAAGDDVAKGDLPRIVKSLFRAHGLIQEKRSEK